MHAATAAINSLDWRDAITDDFPNTTLKTRLTQHDLRGLSPLFGGLSPWNPYLYGTSRALFRSCDKRDTSAASCNRPGFNPYAIILG